MRATLPSTRLNQRLHFHSARRPGREMAEAKNVRRAQHHELEAAALRIRLQNLLDGSFETAVAAPAAVREILVKASGSELGGFAG
jgi:hypothetical protein